MNAKNVYSPYGYHLPSQGVLGFEGDRRDPVTGHYHLGNGYRAFNPSLMRFNSPDNLSPFDRGGFNAYAYCQGDPVNYQDPSGHSIWRMLASALQTPKRVETMTAVSREVKFTQLLGWHGTSRKELPSLHKGLSSGHSEVHRQAQEPGFYVAPSRDHAQKYADVHPDGIVLAVVASDDMSLVPGIGYKKDVFDVVVVREPAFDVVRVREEVPEGATRARLPRTGIFAKIPAPIR